MAQCGVRASPSSSRIAPRGRPPSRIRSKSARPVLTSVRLCKPARVPRSGWGGTGFLRQQELQGLECAQGIPGTKASSSPAGLSANAPFLTKVLLMVDAHAASLG